MRRSCRVCAAAGAVILGKANLSEWANFRGFAPIDFNGWSARGGKTRDPYLLSFDPCGSSSGSAVAPAANLCAAAVGTETDGSVVCPSTNNLVFGIKPTLGLLSQDGIIPIAHSQDTAGPIARTVIDLAILLNVMRTPFGAVAGKTLPPDYTSFLDANSLAGKVIGVDQRYLTPDYSLASPDMLAVFDQGLAAIASLGATLVPVDTGDIFGYSGDEFFVLLMEFKTHVAQYLAGLSHTSMRTLSDLIAFNQQHCPAEMPYYGQELVRDLRFAERRSQRSGLPGSARELPAAVAGARASMPCWRPASTRSSRRATASRRSPPPLPGTPTSPFPSASPTEGRPAGMWMYAGFLQEPKLLAFAYALEQALQPRSAPQFTGTLQPFPPDPGICASLPKKPHVFSGKAHLPHGRLFM